MNNRYRVNDYIKYGSDGVCLIEDIRLIRFPNAEVEREYYILKPVGFPTSTTYVLTDNEGSVSRMRPVMSRSEINDLLHSGDSRTIAWIDERNARRDRFHAVISHGDPRELLDLMRCIYHKRQELAACGKRLTTADEAAFKQAEKLMEGEFSFALGLDIDRVGEYIRLQLGDQIPSK